MPAIKASPSVISAPPQYMGQKKHERSFWSKIVSQRQLVWMSVPLILYVILFSYVPLLGWVMAFQNYVPGIPFSKQQWCGWQQFVTLFTEDDFMQVLRNTVAMSLINLVLGFVTAIAFAILLNEIKHVLLKKTIQTISYMPYFISWVIACDIVANSLSIGGPVNSILMFLHIIKAPVMWLGVGQDFWAICGIANVWKNVGFNAIIYLGAIAGIDPALYESAQLDGASRMQRIWHITLPGIKSIFVVLLIMNVANILNAGFDFQYLLGFGTNIDYSQTIDVFAMKYGIGLSNYSLSTAAGMFKTVVSVILLVTANFVGSKFSDTRLM